MATMKNGVLTGGVEQNVYLSGQSSPKSNSGFIDPIYLLDPTVGVLGNLISPLRPLQNYGTPDYYQAPDWYAAGNRQDRPSIFSNPGQLFGTPQPSPIPEPPISAYNGDPGLDSGTPYDELISELRPLNQPPLLGGEPSSPLKWVLLAGGAAAVWYYYKHSRKKKK